MTTAIPTTAQVERHRMNYQAPPPPGQRHCLGRGNDMSTTTTIVYCDESEVENGDTFRRHEQNGTVIVGAISDLLDFSEHADTETGSGYSREILKQTGSGEDAYCDRIAYAN